MVTSIKVVILGIKGVGFIYLLRNLPCRAWTNTPQVRIILEHEFSLANGH